MLEGGEEEGGFLSRVNIVKVAEYRLAFVKKKTKKTNKEMLFPTEEPQQ